MMKKKRFVIGITETLSRAVVVFAEDRDEAIELVENLANDGVIDLNGSDFCSRAVEDETESWQGVDTSRLATYKKK